MAATQELKLRVLADFVDGITAPVKRILAGNRDLAKSFKDSRDQLKALGQTQKDIGAFRELTAGARASGAALSAAQSKVSRLAAALGASGPPTRAMTREFQAAERAAAKLATEHSGNMAKLNGLRTTLSAAGIDARKLADGEWQLRARITSTTAAMEAQKRQLDELAARTRKLNEARDKLNAAKATAGGLASGGTKAMATGVAAEVAVAVPVSAYAKAEDSATQLQVALMRAGSIVPPEFQKINDLAMRLGDRLPGTTADFQDMMTMLTRQGISAKAILGGMGEATAYLAVQLKKTPDAAAEFAAKLQDATRTSEGDMLALMDVIQRTFYLGVDDNNMLQGFSKLSSAMDTVKLKGLEGAKALAPFLVMADQAGMKGEAAGNALRKVFQAGFDGKKMGDGNEILAAEAKKNPALRGLRLDFTDTKGEFGGLDNMFAQLDKLKGLTTEARTGVIKAIFGDDAETLQVVSLLVEKGAAGYAEVQAKMAAQASLQERVNKQLGTLKNLWEAASGTFTNAMVAFGEAIAPELKAVTEWIGNVSQSLGAWARENPRAANAILKVVAICGVLLIALGGLAVAVAGILGPFAMLRFGMTAIGLQGGILMRVLAGLVGSLQFAGQALLFIGRALLMNPIGLIATAIGLAALLVYRNWEPIKGFFAGLWSSVKGAFDGGLAGMLATLANWSPFGLFYQALAPVLSWFGLDLPARFSEFGANIIAGLVNGITSRVAAVRDAIGNVATSVTGYFKEKLGIHSPSRVMAELGGFVSEGAAAGIDKGQGDVARAAQDLADVARVEFRPPAPEIPAAGDTVQGFEPVDVAELTRAFSEAAARTAAAAEAAKVTRDLAGLGETEFQPGRGPVTPGAGFEAVSQQPIDLRPPVTPAPGSSTGAGIQAVTYEININGMGSNADEIARAVAAEIDRRERARQSRNLSRLSD